MFAKITEWSQLEGGLKVPEVLKSPGQHSTVNNETGRSCSLSLLEAY